MDMVFFLQEAEVKGKQIQIPVQTRWGTSVIHINVCWKGNKKDNPGNALAQELGEILVEHGTVLIIPEY